MLPSDTTEADKNLNWEQMTPNQRDTALLQLVGQLIDVIEPLEDRVATLEYVGKLTNSTF